MYPFIPYKNYSIQDLIEKVSLDYYEKINQRRSVRDFSSLFVSKQVIANIIMAASTAPSGAHKQPWTFCAVSNPEIKKAIRCAAEKEEHENYHGRMNEEWLRDLAPLGTDENKEFLEFAPWIIVVFKKAYDVVGDQKRKNYYVTESIGIACGLLITAIFESGLVALTHTPSPMNFLKSVLKRPEHETPFLLIPVGYAAENAMIPDIQRKLEGDVIAWYE